jgi:tripartite-type tricarboxylate transporter receptor subunit TctC
MIRMLRCCAAALVILAAAFVRPAAAETVRLVTPFAAGGPADLLARLLAQELPARLNADVIVDNRGGAGGVLGTEAVARAPADGKTLLLGSLGSHVVSAALRPQLAYDPLASFDPLVLIGSVPSVLVVRPQLGVASLAELIAKSRQGRNLSYGSAGPGTTMNIAGELLAGEAGIALAHVPYRGAGPAINDLLGGHVDIVIADFPVLLPLISNKSVRALALFGAERSSLLPDVPTTAELGFPQMVMENWYGTFAPTGLAADTHVTLEAAILAALKTPMVAERLLTGGLHGTLDSKAFKARLARDIAYWGPAIKKMGIKGE